MYLFILLQNGMLNIKDNISATDYDYDRFSRKNISHRDIYFIQINIVHAHKKIYTVYFIKNDQY